MPRACGVPQYDVGAQKFHARVRPDILVPASNIARVHLAPSKPDVRRPAGPPPSRNPACKRSLLNRAHCQMAAAANRLPSDGSRPEESPPPGGVGRCAHRAARPMATSAAVKAKTASSSHELPGNLLHYSQIEGKSQGERWWQREKPAEPWKGETRREPSRAVPDDLRA